MVLPMQQRFYYSKKNNLCNRPAKKGNICCFRNALLVMNRQFCQMYACLSGKIPADAVKLPNSATQTRMTPWPQFEINLSEG